MKRIESVDTFRLLAIIAVIAIHTQPFGTAQSYSITYDYLAIVINQGARFAIPFFFVISGFFWGQKIRTSVTPLKDTNRFGVRILGIFIVWNLVYLVPFRSIGTIEFTPQNIIQSLPSSILDKLDNPLQLLLVGTASHLWFLVTLIICSYLSFLFIRGKHTFSLVVLSVILCISGVLAKAYSTTEWGLELNFDTRHGPFFGMLLFVTGYLLSSLKPTASWFSIGFSLYLCGLLLHAFEIDLLWQRYAAWPLHDYVFGTYLMGPGVAMMALSNHPLLRMKLLSHVGRYTLGIYASHYMFYSLLASFDQNHDDVYWEIGYVFIVLLLSILLTLFLARLRITRKWVM